MVLSCSSLSLDLDALSMDSIGFTLFNFISANSRSSGDWSRFQNRKCRWKWKQNTLEHHERKRKKTIWTDLRAIRPFAPLSDHTFPWTRNTALTTLLWPSHIVTQWITDPQMVRSLHHWAIMAHWSMLLTPGNMEELDQSYLDHHEWSIVWNNWAVEMADSILQ